MAHNRDIFDRHNGPGRLAQVSRLFALNIRLFTCPHGRVKSLLVVEEAERPGKVRQCMHHEAYTPIGNQER